MPKINPARLQQRSSKLKAIEELLRQMFLRCESCKKFIAFADIEKSDRRFLYAVPFLKYYCTTCPSPYVKEKRKYRNPSLSILEEAESAV